jgi:hypothetical protein
MPDHRSCFRPSNFSSTPHSEALWAGHCSIYIRNEEPCGSFWHLIIKSWKPFQTSRQLGTLEGSLDASLSLTGVLSIAEATWRPDTTVEDNRRRGSSSKSSSSESGSRRRKPMLRIPKRASAKVTSLLGMARANKGTATGGKTRRCRVQKKRRRESGKKYCGTFVGERLTCYMPSGLRSMYSNDPHKHR